MRIDSPRRPEVVPAEILRVTEPAERRKLTNPGIGAIRSATIAGRRKLRAAIDDPTGGIRPSDATCGVSSAIARRRIARLPISGLDCAKRRQSQGQQAQVFSSHVVLPVLETAKTAEVRGSTAGHASGTGNPTTRAGARTTFPRKGRICRGARAGRTRPAYGDFGVRRMRSTYTVPLVLSVRMWRLSGARATL